MSELGALQQAPARTHRPSGASRLTASDSLRLALAAAWQARRGRGRRGAGGPQTEPVETPPVPRMPGDRTDSDLELQVDWESGGTAIQTRTRTRRAPPAAGSRPRARAWTPGPRPMPVLQTGHFYGSTA